MSPASPPAPPGYTAKQGQYLAFIHAYRRLHDQAPAEADIQRFFRVSPPSVHQMILKLEQAGLITRQPGVARSITLAITPRRCRSSIPGTTNRSKSLCRGTSALSHS
jgi:DNA-binding MarR family transcriptional regulator